MGVSRSLELLVSKHVINQHRTLTSLLATKLLVLCPAAWPALPPAALQAAAAAAGRASYLGIQKPLVLHTQLQQLLLKSSAQLSLQASILQLSTTSPKVAALWNFYLG